MLRKETHEFAKKLKEMVQLNEFLLKALLTKRL